jgi:iron-sulfur cluster assembly protein
MTRASSTISASPREKRALPPLLRLTEAAAARLARLYAGAEQGRLLRISVNTKGCSGHSYQLDWVEGPAEGDEVITEHGVTVLVDRKATLFLIGTVMDWREDPLEQGFVFRNPNEKGRCGCGESFIV